MLNVCRVLFVHNGRRIVKRKCGEGRILGAYKTGSGWLIPENAPYTEDRRSEQNKK